MDAARGIILTNRHVVSPAPIVAQAVLTNYEEVDLVPVYRDPVHDFGFMKVHFLFSGARLYLFIVIIIFFSLILLVLNLWSWRKFS